jgi:hypothetical protein
LARGYLTVINMTRLTRVVAFAGGLYRQKALTTLIGTANRDPLIRGPVRLPVRHGPVPAGP